MVSAFFAYNKEQLRCELFFVVQFNKETEMRYRGNVLNSFDTSTLLITKLVSKKRELSSLQRKSFCHFQKNFLIRKKEKSLKIDDFV